jgi:hypothetical protein
MWIILIILIIFILLYFEYKDHDCIPGKKCNHHIDSKKYKSKISYIRDLIRSNYDIITWRISLIAALIFAFPVAYFLKDRLPTFFEYFIIVLLIFLAVYLSFSWLWAHFLYPNSKMIQKNLNLLQERYKAD